MTKPVKIFLKLKTCMYVKYVKLQDSPDVSSDSKFDFNKLKLSNCSKTQ